MSNVLERRLAKAESVAAAIALRNLAARLAGIIETAPVDGPAAPREHSQRTLSGYVKAVDQACDRVQATLSVLLTLNVEERRRAAKTT